jgi:hypothetical protein
MCSALCLVHIKIRVEEWTNGKKVVHLNFSKNSEIKENRTE